MPPNPYNQEGGNLVSDQPNVVFVLADQLRAASLPLYGETQIQTPHLDRLAAEGVVLDHCISTIIFASPLRPVGVPG